MPTLDARIRTLESSMPSEDVCACPLTIQVVDYRAGIADDGGAGAVPEICALCGKRREIIHIIVTDDAITRL